MIKASFTIAAFSLAGATFLGALPSESVSSDWTKLGFEGILAGLAFGCVFLCYKFMSTQIRALIDSIQKNNDKACDKIEKVANEFTKLREELASKPCVLSQKK